MKNRVLSALLALLMGTVPTGRSIHLTYTRLISVACPSRVAVLGADMSAGGRFEVQRVLRVGPHTVQLSETLAGERAQAHGLIPSALLGNVAVSSVLLHPLPAGSGLRVTLNPAITLHTALTYANALLTAGVVDAEVGVAAPTAQPALGTTALLGLLTAAGVACVPISPARRDLAIREVMLSGALARELGRQAAPSLMLAFKRDAVSARLTAPAALSALVVRDVAARGFVVPAARRAALVAFLHDLVGSGAYARLAAARLSISAASPLQTAVRFAAPAPVRPPSRQVSRTLSRAGVWRGTVTSAGEARVAAQLRGGVRVFQPARELLIYRNGERSSLAALQPGDAVTVTTDAAGLAAVVQAANRGAPPAAAPVAHGASAPAIVDALAGLVVLALILVPVLVALLRRRQTGLPMPAGSAGTRTLTYVPKGIDRAPFKRKGRR